MKKHMKKVLSLLLCTLMIVTAALPVLAEGTEPAAQSATTSGSLVITEVLPKSATEGYSYIEILNTSDTAIDLSGYYLFRVGFSNSNSNSYAAGTKQMLALDNNNVYSGIAAIKLNGTVKAHDTVVVMLNDSKTKNQFINYWNSLGANFSAIDADEDGVYDEPRVIDVDFDTVANMNAKSIHGTSYDSSHKNFLPINTYAMCTLALVPVAEANLTDDPDTWYDDSATGYNVSAKSYLEAADCTVLLNFMTHYSITNACAKIDELGAYSYDDAVKDPDTGEITKKSSANQVAEAGHVNLTEGKSINFTSFLDENTYAAAVAATAWPETVAEKSRTTYSYETLAARNIAVSDVNAPFEALVNTTEDLTANPPKYRFDYENAATSAIAMPASKLESDPTPCELYGTQYGHKETAGPLAITEIMPAPTNEKYEYIEIMNTSDSVVDLSEYYLYRFGFSNGSPYKNLATGIAQMFGVPSNTNGKLVKVSLAGMSGTTSIAPDETAVIWFRSVDAKDEAVKAFTDNWGLTDSEDENSTTDVNVLTLDLHDGTKNLYPAGNYDENNDTSATGYINKAGGYGFLPDASAGFVLSLIHKDKTIQGKTVANDPITTRTYGITQARHSVADCSALLLVSGKVANKAANYYGYVDADKFDKAVASVEFSNTITAGTYHVSSGIIPAGLQVDFSSNDSMENLKAVENTNTDNLKGIPFVNVAQDSDATPGTLLGGQFKGRLAITEICYKPENANYEYVEVVNTSAAEIDLKNYYVYRFGFSNGGTWHASGIMQMFGFNDATCAKLTRVSLEGVSGDTTLAENEVAILWFASAPSKDETVEAFKNYWKDKGVDMTNVNVIKVPVYDTNGTNISPASTIHSNCGSSWLPDARAGFVISMIHKDFAAVDNDLTKLTSAYTQNRHAAADASAFVMLAPSNTTVSTSYNNFVNKTEFAAAVSSIAAKDTYTRIVATPVPTGLMVYDSSAVEDYYNTSNTQDIVFIAVNTDSVVTPGTVAPDIVVEGVQTYTDTEAKTSDTRFVATLKGDYRDYKSVGFEFTYGDTKADVSCKYVYTELNSTEGKISPDVYGADYFFCYTITDISEGTYEISIRSWAVREGFENKVYSETKTASFTVAADGTITFN